MVYEAGYEAGHYDGYGAAHSQVYDNGYEAGHQDGYDKGHKDGYEEGYAASNQDAVDGIGDVYGNSSAYQSVESGGRNADDWTPPTDRWLPSWVDPDQIVYVSNKSHTIHESHYCSGMKNYFEMTFRDAVDAGYSFCMNCW